MPVSVWRATAPDDPPAPPESIFGGLTARLAGMLLAGWTDPGEVVIDVTADPAVQAAAESAARTYRALDLHHAREQAVDLGEAALVLLRWPPRPRRRLGSGQAPGQTAATGPGTVQDMADPGAGTSLAMPAAVLRACKALLSPDGHTVVILAPPTGGIYRDYAREVIPAAREAGLGYLHHLVVITSDVQPAAPGIDWLAHPRAHVDLLVFVLRGSSGTGSGGRA